MRRWEVIVELPAQEDIESAFDWIAKRNPSATDRWFGDIYRTIGSLETLPERCPLASESKILNAEIREILHGRRQHKYRILFIVREKSVYILHVRHGARLALGERDADEN